METTKRKLRVTGTAVFDGDLAQKGYALNKMCFSFNDAANRQAFAADDLELVHAYPPNSSGVRVFIDSAWISSRMRSPSAA